MKTSSVEILSDDVYDIATLCHAAMAQDSPSPAIHYFNQILNRVFPHLTRVQKEELEHKWRITYKEGDWLHHREQTAQ